MPFLKGRCANVIHRGCLSPIPDNCVCQGTKGDDKSLDLKKLKTTLTKSEKLTFVTIFENHTMGFLEFMKLVPTLTLYSYIQQVIAFTFA